MDAGTACGLAGSMMGLMGGAIGTYFSVVNTRKPRERALMIRIAVLGWLWMAALIGLLFLLPVPWNQMAMLLNVPVLMLIPAGNRKLAVARAEDERRESTGAE